MTKQPSTLLLRLFSQIRPFWPFLALGLLASVTYAVIDASLTYFLRPFLDKSFIQVDLEFIKHIPLIIVCGITARGFVGALGGYCMTSVARSVVKALRQKVFTHILSLPADYYDEATSGQLLSKILYDVEQVANVSADALADFVQNVCLVIGFLIVMLVLSWQLSLMFMVTIPFIGLIVNYTNKRVRRISHRIQASMGKVTEIAGEAIDGYSVVRIFGGQAYEIEKFNAATESSRLNDMKVAASKALNVFGVQFIIAVGIAVIIGVAMHLSKTLHMSAGAFVAIIAAMLQLIKPMKILTTLNATIQRGLAGTESIFNLLDQSLEPTTGRSLAKPVRGEIVFKQVNFAYRQSAAVLEGIDFSILPGQTVALVGHSGSGKSTIAKLIPRFYSPTGGTITLDGIPIQELCLTELRQQLSIVNQQVTLFNDTLANNIAYGTWSATREEIIKAAKLAFAHEFIERLPEGYDTPVGENGVLLSGGQRQRIAIARAFLKNAPILIFDEATSALDNESERNIQNALKEVIKNRTTLIIAHRLSTIQQADLILVMHQGQIMEQGTHEGLLKNSHHYAKLYQAQQHTILVEEAAL